MVCVNIINVPSGQLVCINVLNILYLVSLIFLRKFMFANNVSHWFNLGCLAASVSSVLFNYIKSFVQKNLSSCLNIYKVCLVRVEM